MPVYDINSKPEMNVLLTGDTAFVLPFAGILAAKHVPFSILPSSSVDLIMDEDDGDDDLQAQMVAEFGPYVDRVIMDTAAHVQTFTHIVDLTVIAVMQQSRFLEFAASDNPEATIIVSALTSTATEIGALSQTDQRIVGTGLAPGIMDAVSIAELSAGLNTAEHHIERAVSLMQHLGFTVERVEDRVGLVQLRVLSTIINEAAFAVLEGVATPSDIDQAMKLGTNYPKGPLAWADEIGLPVIMLVLDGLYREYQQERYRPCVILKQYVRAGWTGKSAGRGFYVYGI
jgi:3-hydroxybutyryl-CoA dehydrogenase